MFEGCKKNCFLFFCFWFVLLFCTLLWKDFDELVSMTERDHGCSMETFYERCESRLCKGIGEEISREQRNEEKINTYDVG